MRPTYCYWSVVDGGYVDMMRTVIRSARQVGVFKDFHIWCDRPIDDAISHELKDFDKSTLLFKINFLRDAAKALNYDYFVWLDADSYFVRNPGDVLRVLHSSPVHATLECDACDPNNRRMAWWECALSRYARLMRAKGVTSKSIFNVNAGFWIVHHDVIDRFCDLALDFYDLWKRDGHDPFPEEPAMAYAVQMLCGNPYAHTLPYSSDLWASDWTGCWERHLPDGRPWMFENYFNGDRCMVNPAIVHTMRGKDLLLESSEAASQKA